MNRVIKSIINDSLLVPYSVKAVIKNKKIKGHKNPDDSSSNKALILAFFLFTRVSTLQIVFLFFSKKRIC